MTPSIARLGHQIPHTPTHTISLTFFFGHHLQKMAAPFWFRSSNAGICKLIDLVRRKSYDAEYLSMLICTSLLLYMTPV